MYGLTCRFYVRRTRTVFRTDYVSSRRRSDPYTSPRGLCLVCVAVESVFFFYLYWYFSLFIYIETEPSSDQEDCIEKGTRF